jgi:hypothetical protein
MHPERPPNPDRSLEALEARLRAMPQPGVPAGLEEHLLAAIPFQKPLWRWRSAVWMGAAASMAAACLVALVAWLGQRERQPIRVTPKDEIVHPATPRPADDSAGIAAWLEGSATPTFDWPLEENSPRTVSLAIPSDLLE